MKPAAVLCIAASLLIAWPIAGPASRDDLKRFSDLAQANLAEVEAGKLAEQKASGASVKEFAQHMVEEHGRTLDELERLAEKTGARMPGSPSKEQQAAIKKLQGQSGESFDRAYLRQMVNDHQKALELARDTAHSAKDAELRQAAQKFVPGIRKHLQMAQDLAGSARRRK